MTQTDQFLGIFVPAPATMGRHGLSVDDWEDLLIEQGGVCGACGTVPPSQRLNIDHQHVRGWKKMTPEKRKPFVRGLLCYMCNHYRLARGATPQNLRGAADYLDRYEKRRPK